MPKPIANPHATRSLTLLQPSILTLNLEQQQVGETKLGMTTIGRSIKNPPTCWIDKFARGTLNLTTLRKT